MKSFGQHSLAVYVLLLSYTFTVTSATNCTIHIRVSSSGNNSGCVGGNWDGFLSRNCCGTPFRGYLYGLAERENQTGQIFLNSTEQNDCLSSMRSIDEDVVSCGIRKLTSGLAGCSDYTFRDVVDKLGNRFNSLTEGCRKLGSDGGSNQQDCNQCLKSWEENMPTSSNSGNDSTNVQPDNCSFAVLISVISQRIEDDQWFQAIYNCLGDKSLTQGNLL